MTASTSTREIPCPWRGPRPYEEADTHRFFGRANEIEKLLDFVKNQRLSALVALSGVGKTSLLQAGLVPALRKLQELGRGIGPVLVVREWGDLGTTPPAALLIEALRAEILRLSERPGGGERFASEMELLKQVEPPELAELADHEAILDEMVEYVAQLCDVVGEVVLVIDQAEELLGSGLGRPDPSLERRVLDCLASLFRRETRCRVLLSMREEYLGRLNPLNRDVDGLDKRIFRLDPMKRDRVKDAVLQAAQETKGVVLPETEGQSVVDGLLDWLLRLDRYTYLDDEERGGNVYGDAEEVDLLRLQALLLAVFRYAQDSLTETTGADEAAKITLNREVLEDYRQAMAEEGETKDLARRALERYIDGLFEDEKLELEEDEDRYLLRRIVVRMAQWLSSPGGFKRHIGGEELIYNALREDFQVLRITTAPEGIRGAIRRFQFGSELVLEYDESAGQEEVSGRARARELRPPDVGLKLARSALTALHLLVRESVLKKTAGRQLSIYELVHDGFGPALQEWAERHRGSFEDTLVSIVSRCGENFRWGVVQPAPEAEALEIAHQCWLGCNFSDVRFERVVFRNCDLRGTIFLGCTLANCEFIDCELNGLVFKKSTWQDVTWRGCTGISTLVATADWSGVAFESCLLENMTLQNLKLHGSLDIRDSSLRFSQIFPLKPKDAGERFLNLVECDLRNALFVNLPLARTRDQCLDENVQLKVLDADFPKDGRLAQKPGFEALPTAQPTASDSSSPG